MRRDEELQVRVMVQRIRMEGQTVRRGNRLLQEIDEGRTIVGDGAMATLLHQQGVPVRTCYESLCVEAPDLVRRVHRAYVQAGARLLQTNTFSAHRAGLDRYGLGARLEAINRAAVRLAREAATDGVYVFGTVGSVSDLRPGPGGDADPSTAAQLIREQAEVLLDAGVDGILLETFADLQEMLAAIREVRSITDLPIIANLSPLAVGVTRDGVSLATAFRAMAEAGADVVGLNCRLGPYGILRSYEGIQHVDGLRLAAVPNAGLLHMVEGDVSFTGSADYFAEVAAQLYRLGVRLFGGCCGTTPEHIRRLTERLAEAACGAAAAPSACACAESVVREDRHEHDSGRHVGTTVLVGEQPVRPATVWPDELPIEPAGHGGWGGATLVDRVKQDVTILVELDPPRTLDCSKYFEGAVALREAGADYITLADNSLGTVRVSNMALAAELRRMGIEPVVHVTCRDRNLIGQQSHLMGLHVLGIHHVLLVTGDPSRFGDLPGATSVYDTSSIELTRMVKRLNEGIAFSGQPLKKPARFVVGTSFNPHVANFDKAVERLRRKVAAGADFVMTQPMYDIRMFERIASATADLGVPVFVGVMPLVSARNARFLHNEVPGIQIPPHVLERMALAPPETAAEEGIAIATELLDEALLYFRGIYLITPFLRYDMTVRLTRYIRQKVQTRQRSETA